MLPEFGILNINKPEGWTSQDVAAKLRKTLGTKRVGHTGTLDPMASGVLPVCYGRATRIIEYYDADLKTYACEMQLGVRTDTLDRTGTVLEERPFQGITEEEIRSAVSRMSGWVEQIPPKYSALKVNGKRLYEYARQGLDVEIRSRRIYIDRIGTDSIDTDSGLIRFTVRCSKGTYIRTICDDLGQELGCGAVMTALTRTESGVFRLEEAHTPAEVLAMEEGELASLILPMDATLQHLGRAVLKSMESVPFFRNGREINRKYLWVKEKPVVPVYAADDSSVRDRYRMYDPQGQFLGIARYEPETESFRSEKVIIS